MKQERVFRLSILLHVCSVVGLAGASVGLAGLPELAQRSTVAAEEGGGRPCGRQSSRCGP